MRTYLQSSRVQVIQLHFRKLQGRDELSWKVKKKSVIKVHDFELINYENNFVMLIRLTTETSVYLLKMG